MPDLGASGSGRLSTRQPPNLSLRKSLMRAVIPAVKPMAVNSVVLCQAPSFRISNTAASWLPMRGPSLGGR